MTKQELLQIAKPILFNTEMVKAILDSKKTVTRRAIKPQPLTIEELKCMSGEPVYLSAIVSDKERLELSQYAIIM